MIADIVILKYICLGVKCQAAPPHIGMHYYGHLAGLPGDVFIRSINDFVRFSFQNAFKGTSKNQELHYYQT